MASPFVGLAANDLSEEPGKQGSATVATLWS
jgi:hypothetical protein